MDPMKAISLYKICNFKRDDYKDVIMFTVGLFSNTTICTGKSG